MERLAVLFVCVGNSCRSPMAEAMARAMGGGRVRALSAGIAPTGRIAPLTLAVLDELGYPVAGLRSKGLDRVPLDDVDVIVSLIGDVGLHALPPGLGSRREAWQVRDPYGDDEQVYRAVARILEGRVRRLLDELLDGCGG